MELIHVTIRVFHYFRECFPPFYPPHLRQHDLPSRRSTQFEATMSVAHIVGKSSSCVANIFIFNATVFLNMHTIFDAKYVNKFSKKHSKEECFF